MLISKTGSIIVANKRLLDLNAVFISSKRTLISHTKLGITNYKENRNRTMEMTENFHTDYLESAMRTNNVRAMIDQTKRWLHLMEKNECETKFELLRNSLSQIHANSASLITFNFGPLVMRTLHYLNLPENALKLNDDVQISHIFQNLSCSLVLGDLLFESAKYKELLEDVKKRCDSQSKRDKGTSRLVNYLTMAACYKLNTPEYYEYGRNIWENSKKEHQMDQSASFLGMLAINQGEPETALTILPSVNKRFSAVNVRLIALTECGRFEEAKETIKHILATTEPWGFKISEETIKRVEEFLKNNASNEGAADCANMLNDIRQRGRTSRMTLDALLCFPVSEKVDRHDGDLKIMKQNKEQAR